jgi:peptide deformylase|tara:strand:+ start:402 stop:917 length:516 start_codon:yes stop_codon:yes gene_type:complete
MSLETSQENILKINLDGHEALKQVIPETDLTQDLEWDKISSLMYRTMKQANGIGLAANQVSVGIRMFVMYGEITCINPKIVEASPIRQLVEEGCLSFPNLFMKLQRPQSVIVEYYDKNLKKQVDRFEHVWAQCIQHEIEHLDGICFVDKVSKMKLDYYRKKQRKLNDPSRR